MGDLEADVVDTFTSADGQSRTLYLWKMTGAEGSAQP
jgi:hypothetical protein